MYESGKLVSLRPANEGARSREEGQDAKNCSWKENQFVVRGISASAKRALEDLTRAPSQPQLFFRASTIYLQQRTNPSTYNDRTRDTATKTM